MYFDEKHNILILEDKDYDVKFDIKKFIFNIDMIKKGLNLSYDKNYLIRADLTKIKKIDSFYLEDLLNKSCLCSYDPDDNDEQLRVLCPNCLSNQFESVRQAFIPISINDDTFAIYEESVKDYYIEEGSFSFKIYCDGCGNIYEPIYE